MSTAIRHSGAQLQVDITDHLAVEADLQPLQSSDGIGWNPDQTDSATLVQRRGLQTNVYTGMLFLLMSVRVSAHDAT